MKLNLTWIDCAIWYKISMVPCLWFSSLKRTFRQTNLTIFSNRDFYYLAKLMNNIMRKTNSKTKDWYHWFSHNSIKIVHSCLICFSFIHRQIYSCLMYCGNNTRVMNLFGSIKQRKIIMITIFYLRPTKMFTYKPKF